MVNPPDEDPEWPAVRYITNYLDAMENLPDFLAKLTSQMYQLDANCQTYYREFQEHHDVLTRGIADTCERRQVLAKIQNTLGHMQDIGDEKLLLMQEIHDLIEKKARALDIDFKNSKLKIEQENSEPLSASNSNSVDSNPKTSAPNNNEKTVRRGRRAKGDTSGEPAVQATDSSVLSENQTANLPSTSNGVSRRASNASNGKKTKRKSSNNYQNQRQEDEEEGGELLYCICNGISFGKMICCDNDACLQEWFHFGCVKLTIKPKGKWYCPTCRGSKPHLRKPKSQLR